jgi:hypothetical protein
MVAMTPRSAKLGPPAKVAAVVNFYGIADVADQLEGPHMQKYATVPYEQGADLTRELTKVGASQIGWESNVARTILSSARVVPLQ